MTKPFSVEEMLLRINAILRRAEGYEERRAPAASSATSSWTRRATRCGGPRWPVDLTPTEFRLLHYLMVNAGQVVSKAQIRDRVWDYSFDGKVNMVEVYVSYLRKKIDIHGPPMIRTVRGIGYCLRRAVGALPVPRRRRRPSPMTLRLRLLLLSVGIVAAGLVISDVVTYNALRSFLVTRVDQQLDGAAFPVGRALFSTSGLGPQVPAAPRSGFPRAPHTGAGALEGRVPQRRRVLRAAGQRRRAGVLVPPGTYGVLEEHLRQGRGPPVLRLRREGPESAATSRRRCPGRAGRRGPTSTSAPRAPAPGSVAYRALAKPLTGANGVIIIAVPLTDLESTLRQLLYIELVVSVVLLLGLGLVSWVMVRRDLRPLVEITETAGAIAEGDLSQRVSPVAEGTEVGQLGKAFNTMIDEIEGAFAERAASEDRLRRFLADASHELRTPLTSILGYAELFDLGVRDRPDELARSLHHIKDEASRMGTLVDDLFLLAQLDRERPLRSEPVDLTEVVRRSVAGFAVSAPDRLVALDVPRQVLVRRRRGPHPSGGGQPPRQRPHPHTRRRRRRDRR